MNQESIALPPIFANPIIETVENNLWNKIMQSKNLDYPLSYRFTINELSEKLNFPRTACMKAIEKREIEYFIEGEGKNARYIILMKDYLKYIMRKKLNIGFK